MTMTATSMMAINNDDQLGVFYPTMLNELNCHRCCGRMVTVCGRHGIGPAIEMRILLLLSNPPATLQQH